MSTSIDPHLLIALARWARYYEQPDNEARERLQATYEITTIYAGFEDDLSPMGPAIFDHDLRAQVRDIPELHEWIHEEFSHFDGNGNWVSPSKERRVLNQLLHEVRGEATYLVVATASVPTDSGDGFRVNLVRDDRPLPYRLDDARKA